MANRVVVTVAITKNSDDITLRDVRHALNELGAALMNLSVEDMDTGACWTPDPDDVIEHDYVSGEVSVSDTESGISLDFTIL
jgi:hypothetical protein